MTDDLFAVPADPSRPERQPRPCRRHDWRYAVRTSVAADDLAVTRTELTVCARCGRIRDAIASRKGRNNRSRGNAIEREVARQLGMRRVGQYGGPTDVQGELFGVQVKSGGAYPERLHNWLKAVPVTSGQVALLVVTDAPGPGHKRRALVVLDLTDWIALHGEEL